MHYPFITHCGLIMTYGSIVLGRHRIWYLNQCWITISDVLSEAFTVPQWVPKLLFCKMNLKMILLKLLQHIPGANRLSRLLFRLKLILWNGYWLHRMLPWWCYDTETFFYTDVSWLYISDSNFSNTLPVCMHRSLSIFIATFFKMAAWQPYWIVWFLYSKFSLALNIKAKHLYHITCICG